VIFADGLRRMYGEDPEDVFYYLTVYNEPNAQPPMPEGLDEELIRKGLYRYAEATIKPKGRGKARRLAQVLASGSAMRLALEAQRLLAEDWEVAVDVWSAPGWNQLRTEAVAAETWNRLHPTETSKVPYVTEALDASDGPIIAVTDWMKSVPDQIARFVPQGRRFAVLGTDGFGRSDTRPALRRHFRIDAENIVVAVLQELAAQGAVEPRTVADAIHHYRLDPEATTEVP
jgi:pyruvate dehydrogenase E1 component